MRERKSIAHAKRERNLFVLKLAAAGVAMAIRSLKPRRAMAITGRRRPTHLVGQNKRIRVWQQRLVHASNARVVRASKLTDRINLNTSNSAYDPAKVLINSDNSDASDSNSNNKTPNTNNFTASDPVQIIAICQQNNAENPDDLDELFTLCVRSKLTQVVRQNKSMTVITSKLEEVYADLWAIPDPLSCSKNIYSAIFICEHIRKTWTLYLRGKDEFVDVFQAWLPKVEAESSCSMKALRADGRGEFIFIKLRTFCEKRGITIKYAAQYIHEENRLAKRGWRTIVTIKDAMLIDSRLPNDFWAEAMETANYF